MRSPNERPGELAHVEVEEQLLEIDGSATAYRRAGAGSPVLFLHGAGLATHWLPFLSKLAERHDVIAPQHPGYGHSALPDHFRAFDDFALHYDALLRQLEISEPHLVATSLGGRIAAHLATIYPDRFASLTLIAPAGLRGSGPRPDPFRRTPRDAFAQLTNGRAHEIPEFNVDTSDHDFIVESYREDRTLALLTFTERYDRLLPQRLGRVAVPTLVLDAEEDRVLGEGAAHRYAQLIPGAQYEVVAGPAADAPSSHALHVEQPEVVGEAVLRHLERADHPSERN